MLHLKQGEKKKIMKTSKSKLVVIGRASLNIAEMVARKLMQSSSDGCINHHQEVEAKLPINLQIGGVALEANFLVIVPHY